jgi:hypothetical protein
MGRQRLFVTTGCSRAEIVKIIGRHPRTTAVAICDLPGGVGEGQVPR